MDAVKTERRTTLLGGLLSSLRWLLARLAIAAVLACFVFFGWKYFATDRLDEEIRARIEQKFRNHYQGLLVRVESARRVEGRGIEIRGLSISEIDRPPEEPPMFAAERILASCTTDLSELIAHEPEVTSVVMKRVKIRAIRRKSGFWNVRHLFPLPSFSSPSPPVALEDTVVLVSDEAQPDREPVNVRDLQLSLIPEMNEAVIAADPFWSKCQTKPLRLEGSFTGDFLDRVAVRGLIDPRAGYWDVRGSVEGLAFTPRLREALPRDLAAELTPLSAVSGNTHLQFEVDNFRRADAGWQFHLTGNITDGRVDHERLPYPVTEISAAMECDNAGFRLSDLKGRFDSAALELSLQLDGYESTSPLVLRLGVDNLALTDSLAEALPEEAKKFWRSISPSGRLQGKFMVEFDGEMWNPSFECEATDLTLLYEKFPYRLTDGTAKLQLRNDLLSVRGRAWAGNSPVHGEAEIREAGPNWSGWAEMRTEEPVPIDDRLLGALQPATKEIVQSMHTRGTVHLLGRIDRRPGGKLPPRRYVEVDLQDCSLRYDHFPYPIDHITGVLRGTDGAWSFVNLRGNEGSGQIACEGSFEPQGRRLTLNFRGTDVPLDDALRKSLTPEGQKLWGEIRPRGTIDNLDVRIIYLTEKKSLSVEVDAQRAAMKSDGVVERELRLEPIWFPYALDIRAGTVKYKDGSLQIAGVRADHGRTRFEADGSCSWNPDGRWSMKFSRLHSDRLQLDHDLLAALPTDAGRALANAKLSGTFGMVGEAEVSGVAGDVSKMNAAWNLSFDWEDGELAGEVPIEHIHGGVRLAGGVQHGQWFGRGELNVDSMFVRGVQFTKVRGPLYVDPGRLLLGSWAERDINSGPPRQITAQVFDGLVAADASLSLADDGKFVIECSLEQADLAKISRELSLRAENLSGKTFGSLQMTGTTRGKHTWRGGGNIRLRDAYLYKVPVMVAMLKLLSIRTPDSTAFTAGDIDFRIQGDDLVFDHIDLSGDAISLKGRGRLFEQKQIDLLFYTQMGRNELQPAMLRPLMAEAGPHFLLIEVMGTLDDPKVKKTAFPAINETLRQLFPEMERGDEAAKKNPATPSQPVRASWWQR